MSGGCHVILQCASDPQVAPAGSGLLLPLSIMSHNITYLFQRDDLMFERLILIIMKVPFWPTDMV